MTELLGNRDHIRSPGDQDGGDGVTECMSRVYPSPVK